MSNNLKKFIVDGVYTPDDVNLMEDINGLDGDFVNEIMEKICFNYGTKPLNYIKHVGNGVFSIQWFSQKPYGVSVERIETDKHIFNTLHIKIKILTVFGKYIGFLYNGMNIVNRYCIDYQHPKLVSEHIHINRLFYTGVFNIFYINHNTIFMKKKFKTDWVKLKIFKYKSKLLLKQTTLLVGVEEEVIVRYSKDRTYILIINKRTGLGTGYISHRTKFEHKKDYDFKQPIKEVVLEHINHKTTRYIISATSVSDELLQLTF